MNATLAIDGGTPVRSTPMPNRIVLGTADRAAAITVLEREMEEGGGLDRYGGVEVDAYEREFAVHVGTGYATAVSSGTAAIHAALAALDLEPGSEVVTPPVTDAGGVMPIVWQQCIPIFADVDPDTVNLDANSLAARITERTRAIIVTHLAGQPSDMDPIMAVARRHRLPVIEDCAQAHDAVYKGQLVGGIGDLAAFSLMGGKHATAGGQGGMVLTNDEARYWSAKRFADRGKPFNLDARRNVTLGLNYRMTELEAAIGRSQLRTLPAVVARRRALVKALEGRIADLQAVRLGKVVEGAESSYWFLLVRVDADRLRVDHDAFARAVLAEGIPAQARYDHLAYEAPWLRDRRAFGTSELPWSLTEAGRTVDYAGSCPNARRAIDTHMVVAFHEGYGEREIEDIAAALGKVERAYLA